MEDVTTGRAAPLALDRELALITAALRHEFPDLSEQVDRLVEDVTAETVAGARITTYLPILIHRRARWQLKHLRVEPQPAWHDSEPASSLARRGLAARLRRR